MRTVDERVVHSSVTRLFDLVRDVTRWPEHLPHYRYVRFRDRRSDGGGVVEMAADRPFGPLRWPTWWLSEMQVIEGARRAPGMTDQSPTIRFRHIGGVTRGMEVEWSFTPEVGGSAPATAPASTLARIVHLWDGPRWPLIGGFAAVNVIGPVFVHGIASRTLAGLAAAAEAESSEGAVRREGMRVRSTEGITGAHA
jgi:ribosome-associated toxin RatA of RatAB toxin-antitoxin module